MVLPLRLTQILFNIKKYYSYLPKTQTFKKNHKSQYLLQGDPKRLWFVICLWHNEERLNKTNDKITSRVYIGRFDNLPLIYLGPKIMVIKKNKHIVWKLMENGLLYRVQKNIISNIQCIFSYFSRPLQKNWWPILKLGLKLVE